MLRIVTILRESDIIGAAHELHDRSLCAEAGRSCVEGMRGSVEGDRM